VKKKKKKTRTKKAADTMIESVLYNGYFWNLYAKYL